MSALLENASADVVAWRTVELEAYVGGLSNPSKMPGYGYGLPADECNVGSRLRQVEGSTCSGCYAFKGAYAWPTVKSAYRRRLDSLERPLWVEAMAELIARRSVKTGVFRWHDSGDIQSLEHLERIVAVCKLTPDVRHWIPTRESRVVSDYVRAGRTIPENLTIRISAPMVDGPAPSLVNLPGVSVSTVSTADDTYPDAHHCPSRHQGNKCGDCRACWDGSVAHVDYHAH